MGTPIEHGHEEPEEHKYKLSDAFADLVREKIGSLLEDSIPLNDLRPLPKSSTYLAERQKSLRSPTPNTLWMNSYLTFHRQQKAQLERILETMQENGFVTVGAIRDTSRDDLLDPTKYIQIGWATANFVKRMFAQTEEEAQHYSVDKPGDDPRYKPETPQPRGRKNTTWRWTR